MEQTVSSCCWGSLFGIIQEEVGKPYLLMGIPHWPWSNPKWRVFELCCRAWYQGKVKWSHSDLCRRTWLGTNFYFFFLFSYKFVFSLSDCFYTSWGLTSWLSFVVSSVSLSLSHWYPGSGVVLDCIDSWSLHHYLLLLYLFFTFVSPLRK